MRQWLLPVPIHMWQSMCQMHIFCKGLKYSYRFLLPHSLSSSPSQSHPPPSRPPPFLLPVVHCHYQSFSCSFLCFWFWFPLALLPFSLSVMDLHSCFYKRVSYGDRPDNSLYRVSHHQSEPFWRCAILQQPFHLLACGQSTSDATWNKQTA